MAKINLDQLSKQILLKGFVPVILIVFSIVALQYYFYASNELQNNQKNLSVIAQNLSTKIEGSNQFAVGLAETMAQAQTNGLFGNRLSSSQFAKDVLTSHPTLTGAYFGYEQNADQSDQLFLASTNGQSISQGLDQSGRFLPYWFRETNQQNTVTLTPLINMESSLYYQGVKERFDKDKTTQYLVTEPYEYEGKLIVEQVFPIVVDGEFKGVAGVDRALTDLVNLLKIESQNYAVDVFLISDQGRFISSTIKQNTNLLTLSVEQTPYNDLFASPVLNRNADWFKKAIDPFEQKEYFYTASNVKTGNWLVIVRKSKDLVTGIIWQTAAFLLGLSLIGLVISGWLIYMVLKRTSNRINLALNAATELAKGEIPNAERLYNTENNDEISILLSSFSDVVEHYENIKLCCQRMADGDFATRLTEKSAKDVLSQSLNALAERLHCTEKDMLEALHQAESANQSKSQFLANMSHEIRTPMNAVLGLSRLCLNTELTKQQKDYLEKIQSSGSSLLNIINDTLDFSKIESGKLELEKTPFSLESVFEDLSRVAMASAHQKGLELLFNVPYCPVIFKGDPLRLGQILTNLTSNAIKFTERGEVGVNVKITSKNSTHSLITFEVTDQGIGISPEQQQKLFSAFTQAENSTTPEFGGTGLGLVICKNLVELMGGHIHISSELGVGTKVSFSIEFEQFENKQVFCKRDIPEAMRGLRILVADDNSRDTSVDEKWQLANNTKLQGAYVLVAEDNLINQQIIAEYLQQAGIKYDIVKNGKEAVEHVQKHKYHAVLMDLQMPIMGGIKATEIIRTLPEGKLLPIIAMTANAMEQHKQACLNAGMNSHLAKPIDLDKLYAILEQYIGRPLVTNKTLDQQDTPTELSTYIAELTHVDFNLAMSCSYNEMSIVMRLMTIFRNSHQHELPLMEQAIVENSHNETTDIAHNLAGVAEYVGAKNLANLARNYENFDGDTGSDIHLKGLQSLYNELKGVMQELDGLLAAHSPQNIEFNLGKVADINPVNAETSATLPTFVSPLKLFSEVEQIQKLLIVDDDPISIAILQNLLQSQYQLSTAENGQKALDKITEDMPDLILLDIHMPIMDGFTTCEKLKQTPKYANIPIIFITDEENADEAKCLNLGAVDFISKPFITEIVKARVATHMALKQKSNLLLAKGLTDELTQVANRWAYKERITDELARSKRDKTPLSLLMIDLDKFKLYNDNYGHLMGDQCLQKVASFLSLQLKRPADFIARVGGEEFIVILPNTSLDGANEIAIRLKNCVTSLGYEHALSAHKVMTVSIGVVTAKFANLKNDLNVTADELMTQADIGLYKAKKAGGNQVNCDTFIQI